MGFIFPEVSSLYGSELELPPKEFFQEIWMVQVKERPLPFDGCNVRCGGRLRGD